MRSSAVSPLPTLASLLADFGAEPRRFLASVPYSTCIQVLFRTPRPQLDRYAVFISRSSGSLIDSVTEETFKSRRRAPAGSGLTQVFVTDENARKLLELEDPEIAERVHRELRRLLPGFPTPVCSGVIRRRRAMVLSGPGFQRGLAEFNARVGAVEGLHMISDYQIPARVPEPGGHPGASALALAETGARDRGERLGRTRGGSRSSLRRRAARTGCGRLPTETRAVGPWPASGPGGRTPSLRRQKHKSAGARRVDLDCAIVVSARRRLLPGKSRLARYVWRHGVPYNHIQDESSLHKAAMLDIALRKWQMDSKWRGVPGNVSWLRFQFFSSGAISRVLHHAANLTFEPRFLVDIAPDELLYDVDRRAFLRATLWFAQQLDGLVIAPGWREALPARSFSQRFNTPISARFALGAPPAAQPKETSRPGRRARQRSAQSSDGAGRPRGSR